MDNGITKPLWHIPPYEAVLNGFAQILDYENTNQPLPYEHKQLHVFILLIQNYNVGPKQQFDAFQC